MTSRLVFLALATVGGLALLPAHASLLGRDLDGNAGNGPEAYYDTQLNITWLRDIGSGPPGEPGTPGYPGNQGMTWSEAEAWAQQDRYGLTGWRLPTVRPRSGTSFNLLVSYNGTTDLGFARSGSGWGLTSEMGHLFYVDQGNSGLCNPFFAFPNCQINPAWSANPNRGGFSGMDPRTYAVTGIAGGVSAAWRFSTSDGSQNIGDGVNLFAMAVRAGDVPPPAAVPVPASLPLLGLGLAALLARGLRRRQG